MLQGVNGRGAQSWSSGPLWVNGARKQHKAHILVTSSEREIKDASHKERERQETTSTSALHYKGKKERKKTVKRHTSKQAVEKKTSLFKQSLKVSFKDKTKKRKQKKIVS